MGTKFSRIVTGTVIAGALFAAAPAGLAFADDVVNPPTDTLNHGQLNAVVAQADRPALSLAEIEFLPVIPAPGKIFCVGHNFNTQRIQIT